MRANPLPLLFLLATLSCGGDGGSGGSGTPTTPSTPTTPTAPATVATVTVDHAGESILPGATLQLTATARDAQGSAISGRSVTWTSSSISIGTVSASGLVSALSPGTVVITARVDNVNGTSSLTVRSAAPFQLTTVGRVLGPSDIGEPANDKTGTADVSAIELPDKRIRLYFSPFRGGTSSETITTAISSDSIHFTIEGPISAPTGQQLNGGGQGLIYRLPDGRYRMFFGSCFGTCTVVSATGTDGRVFTPDPGTRFATPNGGSPACGGIAALPNGTYRMYCSVEVSRTTVGTLTTRNHAVFSALSSDLLSWTVESGYRIGPGSPSIQGSANHPTVIVNVDGSTTLIYFGSRGGDLHEIMSTAKEGLTFDTEFDTGVVGSEPSVLKRADGSLLLYHGGAASAATDGSTIALSRLTKSP